jgi:hypothetical protein
MDTRLRNRLHDLASEMPVDVEGSKSRTLRRARGRRVLTAGAGVAVVLALVAVSVSALRLVDPGTSRPAVTGPTPARVFEGLWPETDADALAVTQEAVDGGAMPLRTTPDGTASLLAVNLLGWQPNDVQIESTSVDGDEALVVISNRILGDPVPPITVEVRQLGETGPQGIWCVVGLSTPLIEIDELAAITPESPETMPGFLILSGSVTDVFDGAPAIEAHVFDGPALVPSLGSSRQRLTDGRFDFTREISVEATPDGRATLLLTIPDPTGASVGAVMVPVDTPVGEAEPSGPNLTGVPPDVAVTAQRIYDAAKAKDFDALAELIDPNTFIYNLGDASDPIPEWRANPSELELMVAILEMPPTTRDIGPGYGTFYFWPYLVNSDFSSLTALEHADLAALGYSDREIQLTIDGDGGYQGPRLAIDETGEWRNFLTVGE